MSFSKSRQSTFHAKVQEELICGICLDFLSEPKLLSCAHSFCCSCLRKVLKKVTESSIDLECPSCRQSTLLKSGSVNELNVNYNLKRLVDIVSEEEKKKTRDVIKRRCSTRCSIRQSPQASKLTCKLHSKQMEYFCVDCNTLICPKCIKSDHLTHRFEDVDDIFPSMLSTLRNAIQPACEVVTLSEQVMNTLYKQKSDIGKNCDNSIQEVTGLFKQLVATLDAREKNIVSTIRKYHDIRQSRLDAQYQMLRTHHDAVLESVSQIEQLVEGNEGVAIVSQKQTLCDQLEVHEQSIISLVEMIGDNKSFLSFKICPSVCNQLEELGELEEYVREPKKAFYSVRKVVVSEEEDPYNDVPLRFEDVPSDGLQVEVRTDETNKHIEYEPESKPASNCDGPKKPPLPKKPHSRNPPVPPKPSTKLTHPPKVPPKPVNKSKKSLTLPNLKSLHASCVPLESSDEYDPIEDFSQPPVISTPPPIPPNHPGDRLPPRPSKKKSLPSIPYTPSSHGLESEVIQPLVVLESKQMCRPYSNETVYPNGVCCTQDGTLLVSDVNNDCLRMVDDGGNFIGKIGTTGLSGGQIREPSALAVDHNNFIFVCERDNRRIQKFTPGGKYVTKFGQRTLISSVLSDPIGIAISPDGKIAVSDWDRNQIVFFTSTGKHFKTDRCQGCLKFPAGIAYTPQGNLLVVDRGNHCIWTITKKGEISNKMGSYGSKAGHLCYPYGVAVRKDGTVIVTESGNNRISVFSPSGQFIRSLGKQGSEPGMFDHPRHVCVDAKGNVVVADEMNNRIQIFSI